MKTRTSQMKKLVISGILFYAAGRIASAGISVLSSDTQSAVSVYAGGAANLLSLIAGIIQLVLCVKILGAKVLREEPHRIKIRHLKIMTVISLVMDFAVAFANIGVVTYLALHPNEMLEFVVYAVNRVISVVSWILIILIFYRVLVSKAEFDEEEETTAA